MLNRPFITMSGGSKRASIKGVIFDMGYLSVEFVLILDGTLCLPQNWMFGQMREALGIDNKTDVLTYIESLPTPGDRLAAHAKIEKVEEDAMLQMVNLGVPR
jgi:hypothetical protein